VDILRAQTFNAFAIEESGQVSEWDCKILAKVNLSRTNYYIISYTRVSNVTIIKTVQLSAIVELVCNRIS